MKQVEIEIPEEATVKERDKALHVEGPNGSVETEIDYPGISAEIEDGKVVLTSDRERRNPLATLGTYESEVRNALHGVTEGFEYEMKVLYSHFPMQVEVKGDEVEVRNFLGEKHPRTTEILGETEVQVRDKEITLTGPDREDVGQTAANIEQLTRVNEKDIRVFQDGIYITKKPKV